MSNPRNLAPAQPVALDPPKDDPITVADLAKADGSTSDTPIYVAIKGTVFDVTRARDNYGPGGAYHVFSGKDASRGLAKSSVKPEDALAEYEDLSDKEKGVLNDWYSYFSQRYNIIGKVQK